MNRAGFAKSKIGPHAESCVVLSKSNWKQIFRSSKIDAYEPRVGVERPTFERVQFILNYAFTFRTAAKVLDDFSL